MNEDDVLGPWNTTAVTASTHTLFDQEEMLRLMREMRPPPPMDLPTPMGFLPVPEGVTLPVEVLNNSMPNLLTGTLIDELFERHPELVGPLKDQIEELELRDQRREQN